ncbi:unnamed protein product [Acanthoscelides obtectus]|nr:unnamed protein product [Acanthoscelides obtectus]CAK1623807.1 hypothetical protein AOBTE_LOCUS2198 [Acanthoscelides obtectus]
MATRVNRKNATGPSPKEVVPTEKPNKNEIPVEPITPKSRAKASIGRRITKRNQKNVVKTNNLALKLKAKTKNSRINPLAKNVKAAVKVAGNRNKLLKNGVKEVKPRKTKIQVKQEKEDIDIKEEAPPVLEPIFPLEENVDKKPKKRVTAKKAQKLPPEVIPEPDLSKVKIEKEESPAPSDVTDVSNQELPKQVKKSRLRRAKTETETLEDVMNDLSFLIKQEVKTEPDYMSESGKSDSTTLKPKKLTKKQRIELLKQSIVKKENLENTLSKLDAAGQKVIDMLDLNVKNIKKVADVKRRHSIEKFPIGSEPTELPLAFFGPLTLPRSGSPRSRGGIRRKASPYSTRSDSPARKLRSGRPRKNMGLLDGLEETRKRRRLCSDLSTGDLSTSKVSGYESDNSSFSDMTSTQSSDQLDTKEPCDDKQTASNGPISIIDTNSNLCDNLNELKTNSVEENLNFNTETSEKVPHKSIILDIMKKTFNEMGANETHIDTMETTKFYGKSTTERTEVLAKPEDEKGIQSRVEDAEEKIEQPSACAEEREIIEPGEPNEVQEDEPMEQIEPPELSEQNVTLEDAQQAVPMEKPHTPESIGPPELVESIHASIEPHTVTEQESFTGSDMVGAPTIPEEAPVLERAVQEQEFSTQESHDMEIDTECNNKDVEHREKKTHTDCHEASLKSSEDSVEEELIDDAAKKDEEIDLENGANTSVGNMEVDRTAATVEETDRNKEDIIGSCSKMTENNEAVESEEDVPDEYNILKALGLQSLRAAAQDKQKPKPTDVKGDVYTGTLKTVIKINRDKRKGGRKVVGHKGKSNKGNDDDQTTTEESSKDSVKGGKEGQSTSWRHAAHSSDTAGARKSHYSNRSNMDGSSEHTSDGEAAPVQDGTVKALVIPEKASSFSIHPGRLCKDECSYCFGKFGLFDTPCHIAQMKSVERQDKILATEKHLTRDSCLCDACYRHVDRKSNTPSYSNRSLKRSALVAPGPRQNHCHVLGCDKEATNILRRKWIIKMRKSICQEINIDLDNPGLHSIPICSEHHARLEHLMVCAMCKRRLARNHAHRVPTSEAQTLAEALEKADIPIQLAERPVICKLCKCFGTMAVRRMQEDDEDDEAGEEEFFSGYKRRLLHFNDIAKMDEAAAEEPLTMPSRIEKKKKLVKNSNEDGGYEETGETPEKRERVPSSDMSQSQSRSESPSDDYNGVDYNTLIPAIAMDCGSDSDFRKDSPGPGNGYGSAQVPPRKPGDIQNLPSVEITKISKLSDSNKNGDLAVQKLGCNPSISVRQLFPGEEELPLNAHIDFNSVKDKTPEGWERGTTTIQYDLETKRLWQELQKPYGNQSSFMRHLILLEKYFRNGDLVLSPRASHHSINYSESVHNRLRAYDNIPSSAGNIQPLTMLQFNKMQRSSSGIITSASANPSATITSVSSKSQSVPASLPVATTIIRSTPGSIGGGSVTLTQVPTPPVRPPSKGPPGLISIQSKPQMPPTSMPEARPMGRPPLRMEGPSPPGPPVPIPPQSQKIKFPITKNWRPNLIPIEPGKGLTRQKGLVQVISGGKPFHITLEDYKKMCAIKRSFEMKQRRMQEAAVSRANSAALAKAQASSGRRGLIISKTMVPTPAGGPQPLHVAMGYAPPPVGTSKEQPLIGPGIEVIEKTTPTELNGSESNENILEKLDKHVEKIGANILPKIPKSLTVIPQTVPRKPQRPDSPILQITKANRS